jgi:hypothetical protein
MIPTFKTVLLMVAGAWGLACLVLLVAMGWAASRPSPDMKLIEQWQPKPRRMAKKRGQAEGFPPLQT